FLVNAAGTGKSRLMYEGLCQHWGLYLNANPEYEESQPLVTLLSEYNIRAEAFFIEHLPPKSTPGFTSLVAKNREIAETRFSAILLAYLTIFKEFLEIARLQNAESIDEQKRRWLLCQIKPPESSLNPFDEIVKALEFSPAGPVSERLNDVLAALKPLLPDSVKKDGFYIVIDEANAAIADMWTTTDAEVGAHSALRELIDLFKRKLSLLGGDFITFVVTGTKIPAEYFSSPEWSTWKWSSDTGCFDTPEMQRKYIDSFFPLGFEAKPGSDDIYRRMWNWSLSRRQYRHRMTAFCISVMLKHNGAHPHRALNEVIRHLTAYNISEAEEPIEDEYEEILHPCIRRPRVELTVHEAVMSFIITGQKPPSFPKERIELVNERVGQFIDEDMSIISIDEPLLVTDLALFLAWNPYFWDPTSENRSLTFFSDFCFRIQGHWPSGDTYAAESYIALYFAHVFQETHLYHFSEVFTIPSAPTWLTDVEIDGKFPITKLVLLCKDEGGALQEMVVTSSALLPDAPPLGYIASSANDVLAWLLHERSGVFCICPPECGADLIFVLKRRGRYFWVLLRTASATSIYPNNVYVRSQYAVDDAIKKDAITSDQLQAEYEKLAISSLFPRNESLDQLSEEILSALAALPNGLATDGQLSLLRVVVTFPGEPSFDNKNIEGPPVSVLNPATFQEATEAIPAHNLFENLISSMQDKRASRYVEGVFSPVTTRMTGSVTSFPSAEERERQRYLSLMELTNRIFLLRDSRYIIV
ncbi:hypothetical protein H0H93_016805, partial [Arthromyces matolae]